MMKTQFVSDIERAALILYTQVQNTITKADLILPEVYTPNKMFSVFIDKEPIVPSSNMMIATNRSDPPYVVSRVEQGMFKLGAYSVSTDVSVIEIEEYRRAIKMGHRYLGPMERAIKSLKRVYSISNEIDCAKIIMDATSYHVDNVVPASAPWTGAGSDSITWKTDIEDAIDRLDIEEDSQLKLIVPKSIWKKLKGSILAGDKVNFGSISLILQSDKTKIAEILGVNEVIVVEDTTKNGAEMYGSSNVALIAVSPLMATMESGFGFGYKAVQYKDHLDMTKDVIRGEKEGVIEMALKWSQAYYVLNNKAGILFTNVAGAPKTSKQAKPETKPE